MLKTKEMNQKPFTASSRGVLFAWYENCIMVAVTPDNSAATVDKFTRLVAEPFCAPRMVGIPSHAKLTTITIIERESENVLTDFDKDGDERCNRLESFGDPNGDVMYIATHSRRLDVI